MVRFTLDPGRLNRQLTLEAPDRTADGAGGQAPAFTTVGPLAAALDPLGPETRDVTGFAVTAARFRVTFRFRADVTLAHRFRLGSRLFPIDSLLDPDDTRRFLIALCREEAP